MKKFIQRWLGITYINNSTVHKDILWTELNIINNRLDRIESKVLNNVEKEKE